MEDRLGKEEGRPDKTELQNDKQEYDSEAKIGILFSQPKKMRYTTSNHGKYHPMNPCIH